ncbi:bactofilin family protein [Paenibacillus sp. 481]|uniref:bactofilin family protein n=1 Tax=Paenibacillus sp. 481 TaxID=2835869 RepID=UPI001E5FFDC8|nr:polymer-forming cytoskeletal protein [Paenibacillus sp. 481]UHA71976.1 polymer-forming cytoskeletal protein [Paenibacillus sp. 481]
MFRKHPSHTDTTDTLIGKGTIIEGVIHCESSLRIDGTLKGDVTGNGNIVIGKSGEAYANITAKQVIVAGKVFGEIRAAEKLTITETGQIRGLCESGLLIVLEGGIWNGTSVMEKEDQLKEGSNASGVEHPSKSEHAEKMEHTENTSTHDDAHAMELSDSAESSESSNKAKADERKSKRSDKVNEKQAG